MAAILVLVPGLALAQATETPYTAAEWPTGLVDPGTWTYPGGNIHIRGYTLLTTRSASDPRVNGGTLRGVINFNLDKSGSGPIWGSYTWELEGGAWEGTLQGKTNIFTQVGYYDAVWHGSGKYRGLQVKETCVFTGSVIGTCTGRILETPAK